MSLEAAVHTVTVAAVSRAMQKGPPALTISTWNFPCSPFSGSGSKLEVRALHRMALMARPDLLAPVDSGPSDAVEVGRFVVADQSLAGEEIQEGASRGLTMKVVATTRCDALHVPKAVDGGQMMSPAHRVELRKDERGSRQIFAVPDTQH